MVEGQLKLYSLCANFVGIEKKTGLTLSTGIFLTRKSIFWTIHFINWLLKFSVAEVWIFFIFYFLVKLWQFLRSFLFLFIFFPPFVLITKQENGNGRDILLAERFENSILIFQIYRVLYVLSFKEIVAPALQRYIADSGFFVFVFGFCVCVCDQSFNVWTF